VTAYRWLLSQGYEPKNIGSTGLADDGAALAKRLAAAGVTSQVHPLAQGQHSFILGAGRVPQVDQAIDQMGQWLRRHLGA